MSGIRTRSLVSGVLLAFAVSISNAEENEQIAACNLVESSEARIACLEDAIRRLSNETSDLAAETPETPSSVAELQTEAGSQADDAVSTVAVVAIAQAVCGIGTDRRHCAAVRHQHGIPLRLCVFGDGADQSRGDAQGFIGRRCCRARVADRPG